MSYRDKASARLFNRQDEYQRLVDVDARRLWRSGRSMMFIAGRADTTIWFVRRWLREAEEGATPRSALDQVSAQSTPKMEQPMAQQPDHRPGDQAPSKGVYEQINIFGQPNGIRVDMNRGHSLPAAPIGHFWRWAEEDDGDGR